MTSTEALKDSHTGQDFRIPELDGLRGIAILLVCLFHFNMVANPAGRLEQVVDAFCSHLWFGVDLFFVLSGFLITTILLEAKGSPRFFSSFYMRRVLRILPLYYLTLLVYLIVSIFRQRYLGQSAEYRLQLAYWLYVQNWAIIWNKSIVILGHFWSLAVEEQFYLVWPIIIYFASAKFLKWLCGSLIGLAFLFKLGLLGFQFPSSDTSVAASYTLTPARVDTLAIGGLVALMARHYLRFRPIWFAFFSLVFTVAFLFLNFTQGRHTFWYKAVEYSAIAPVCGFLIARSSCRTGNHGFFDTFLRSRALRSIGKYSYAMYIVHWPLNVLLHWRAAAIIEKQPTNLQTPAKLAYIFLLTAFTYALGWMSWNVIEKRILSLKRLFPMGRVATVR